MGPGVLLVCTANICRSPAAERLFRVRLSPYVEFFSRGTRALPGAQMCETAANWTLMHGASAAGHVSRQLESADIEAATLIFTASERHKARVVSLRPSAQRRTYTLLQAARIVRWRTSHGVRVPARGVADRLEWLAGELDEYRGVAPRPVPEGRSRRATPTFGRSASRTPAGDGLPDPHEDGRHPEVFRWMTEAVDVVCAVLLGPGLTTPLPRFTAP